MKRKFKLLLVSLILLSGLVHAAAEAAVIDFEDIALGGSYNTGDTFVVSGVTVVCKNFQWDDGTWYSGGSANVGNDLLAGGSGYEMGVNNINLDFNFGTAVSSLSLRFGEYGGNLNIEINGVLKNFTLFSDINGLTIGNVMVTVVNGFGNDQGTLELSGAVSQFAIGGQELWIDDVIVSGGSCSCNDSDGDGVIDQWDECPDTPTDSFVNNEGCSAEQLGLTSECIAPPTFSRTTGELDIPTVIIDDTDKGSMVLQQRRGRIFTLEDISLPE